MEKNPINKKSPLATISIVINNIRFILLAKTIDDRGYTLVNIMSKYSEHDESGLPIDKGLSFFVYKSFSEIGLWRLAAKDVRSPSSFFKGLDYVQSSLIHLELQNLINEYYHELPHIERLYDDRLIKPQTIPGVELVPNETLLQFINSTERVLRVSPFAKFAESTFCGNMFKKTDEELQSEREAKNRTDVPPMFRQTKKSMFNAEDLNKLISNDTLIAFGNKVREEYSIKSNPESRDSIERTFIYSVPDFFVTSSHDMYGIKTGNYDYGVTVKNSEIYKVSLIKNGEVEVPLSATEESTFTSVENIDLYYAEASILNKIQRQHSEFVNKEFLEKNRGTTFFGDEIGEKEFMEKFEKIKTKNEAKELMRAYGKNYPRNEDKFCGKDKRHFMPFLLTTTDSLCTPIGLYSKYIPAGVYICKMFDYRDQCTLNERRECLIERSDYVYIGDRYKNVFPFDIIEDITKKMHDINCRTHKRITSGPGSMWASRFTKSNSRGGKRKSKRRRTLKKGKK
jgi:hypothetical protein